MNKSLPPGVQHFSRYGTFSVVQEVDKNPLDALQRDSLLNLEDATSSDQNIRPFYASQLQQLECLIRTQRDFQNLMKTNYAALLEKYKTAINELDRLRKQMNSANIHRMIQDKAVLEHKFQEQVKARIYLENMFRALLQTLRGKCIALEKARQKIATTEQERDSFKVSLDRVKKKKCVLEQRLLEALNSENLHSYETIPSNRNSMNDSRFSNHSAIIQRSYEGLQREGSEKRVRSLTRSLGKINSVTSPVVASPRPSLPLNLLRSSIILPPRRPVTFSPETPQNRQNWIRLNLIACNPSYSANGTRSLGGTMSPLRLGKINLLPQTTWDQFDDSIQTILNGYAQTIATATDGNRFSSTLHLTSNPRSTDSTSSQAIYDSQITLNEPDIKSEIRLHIGHLDWMLGSPPTPKSLSIRRLQLLQGLSLQESCSTPYELCAALPSSSFAEIMQSNNVSTAWSSGENLSSEKIQKQHQLVITLDSISQTSMECGMSRAYVYKYLNAMKSHMGLILIAKTGILWATRLLNSLAGLFMNEVQLDDQSFKRYTITRDSLFARDNTFDLQNWLYRQNLIQFGTGEKVTDCRGSETGALLVFESLDFLRNPVNRKTLSHLLGISCGLEDKPTWTLRVKHMVLLGLSDWVSIEWIHQSATVRNDMGWLVNTTPPSTDELQLSTSNSLLLHELSLSHSPLIDVVPVQLRLAAHKVSTERNEQTMLRDESSAVSTTSETNKTKELHPDIDEMCRWIESIWTRLFVYLKWLGVQRIQRLNLEPNDSLTLPDDFLLPASATELASDKDSDGSLWKNMTDSLITAQVDKKTEQLIEDLLNPDQFLSFPGIQAALHEDSTIGLSEMLKWIERKWNEVFEPGLQMCALSVASLETDSENHESNQPFLYFKLNDPVKARHRIQQGLRHAGSDEAATLFFRQIIMHDCPLQGNARTTLSTRLTGGDALQSRLGHSRRLISDASDTICSSTENKAPKQNIRITDETPVSKRAQSERSRVSVKPSDGHTMGETNDTSNRWNTGQRKKPPRMDGTSGRTRTSGFGDPSERVRDIVRMRSSGGGNSGDISTLPSSSNIRGETYRPVRFRTHYPQRTWPNQSAIYASPLREQSVVVHRVNVKLNGKTR